MCQNCCQQPIKLQDKPENCTPEQIRACHGDVQDHPCMKEKKILNPNRQRHLPGHDHLCASDCRDFSH